MNIATVKTSIHNKVYLALGSIPDDFEGDVVVAPRKGEYEQRNVEVAGRACFDRYERVERDDESTASDEEDNGSMSSKNVMSNKGEEKEDAYKKKRRGGNILKMCEELEGKNLYDLLGVSPNCSVDDLRKAFRSKSLLLHPDKHADKSEKEQKKIASQFIAMTEANDILMDTTNRRKYNSTLPFDDDIPSNTKASEVNDDVEAFIALFGPVFERNAKWSEKKAPLLPGKDASLEKVNEFYKFWFSFQSWRCMDSQIIEEEGDDAFQNLKDAECREERRWMERENARIRKKYLSQEYARIRELVDLAEKNDPRLRAAREAEFNKKNAAKLEKERLQREAREKQEAEQLERERIEKEAEEARKIEKAKKEEAKNAIKKIRQGLRGMCKDHTMVCPDQFQELMLSLENEQLASFLETLTNLKPDVRADEIYAVMRSNNQEPIIIKPATPSTTVGNDSELEFEEEVEVTPMVKKGKKNKKGKNKAANDENEVDPKILEQQEKERMVAEMIRKEEREKREEKARIAIEKKEKEKARKAAQREERERIEAAQKAEQAAQEKDKEMTEKEKRAEQQREAALTAKREAEQEREMELRTVRFNQNRTRLLEVYGTAQEGLTECQKLLAQPEQEKILCYAMNVKDEEMRIDTCCSMLATQMNNHPNFETFLLGKRQLGPNDQYACEVNNAVRNRMKKVRTAIRGAVKEALSGKTEVPCSVELKPLLSGLFPLEGWEVKEEAPKEDENKPKKGGKKKATKEPEEDLDALLQEFNATATGKNKNKNKKK